MTNLKKTKMSESREHNYTSTHNVDANDITKDIDRRHNAPTEKYNDADKLTLYKKTPNSFNSMKRVEICLRNCTESL